MPLVGCKLSLKLRTTCETKALKKENGCQNQERRCNMRFDWTSCTLLGTSLPLMPMSISRWQPP